MENINYEKEFKKVSAYTPKEYFKAEQGKHEIIILSEPTTKIYSDGDEVTPQIEMQISVNKQLFYWTVSKGVSFLSVYGQLMALGKEKNQLKEQLITLIVTGEGKNKTYAIVEAMNLLPKSHSAPLGEE